MITNETKSKFKIILIGDMCTGKTNFLLRFCQNHFNPNYEKTVGIKLAKKTLALNGKIIELTIIDTSGDPKCRPITNLYQKGANGYILFYDITNRYSYDSIPIYLNEIRHNSEQKHVVMLVGTKYDLTNECIISPHEVYNFASKENLIFFETSSKMGINVSEALLNFVSIMDKELNSANICVNKNLAANKSLESRFFDYFSSIFDRIKGKDEQNQSSICLRESNDDDVDLENPK